jgi:DNA-binding transcriptional LysR family regulator
VITSTDSILRRLRGSHIALLIALDDYGSLRQAAQHIALSQPATTKALQEIESMFGAELFNRSPRGIEANELGRCVVRHARALRASVGALRDELTAISRGSGGTITIGAVMGSVPTWLTPTLGALRQEQPHALVEVWEDNSARLLSMLDQRNLDVVIGRTSVSVHPEAYDFIPLEVEEMCFVIDGAHPHAGRATLRLRDIAEHPWIVPQAQLPLRSLLEQLFADENLPFPAYAIETSSTFATLSLLRAQEGTIGMLPLPVARYFADCGLIGILPIRIARTGMPYGIATRRGVPLTPVVAAFIRLCQARAENADGGHGV